MVKIVKENEFDTEVVKSELPVIIDCYADWCGPCKMLAPIFEETSKDYEGKVKFVKLNADDSPDVAGNLGIRSLPTLIIMKDGQEVTRQMGFMDKAALKQFIDGAL